MIGAVLGKPITAGLVYLVLGLGLALLASTGYAYKLRADVATAEAAQHTAEADLELAQGERDAAAQRAGELAGARDGWIAVAGERGELLQACQAENTRVQQAGQQALGQARAQQRDAERTLAAFTAKYQAESRKPDCERARHAMAAACPALRDY